MIRRWLRRTAPILVLAALPARAAAEETLSLSVEDAVRLAIRNGESAAIARQDVLSAEAETGIAFSPWLPQLTLDAAYTRNLKKPVIFFPDFTGGEGTQSIEIGEDNDFRAQLSLTQTLFTFGRVWSAYHGARDGAEAARLTGKARAADIALEVRAKYYAALLTREQLDLTESALTQAERRRDEIAARVENGVLPRFDLLRAEVEVANRRPVVTRARNAAGIALDEVKRVTGLSLDREVVLTDALAYAAFDPDRDQVVAEAIEGRPDLEAARRTAAAARNYLTAQARADMPAVGLTGTYAWQGQTSDGFFPEDDETAESASLGVGVSWPIFDGFANGGRVRQARANATKAELAVRALERAVRVQARSAWGDVRSIAEELVGAEESIRVAQEAYEIAETRYQNGLSTQLEVVDTDLALQEARLRRSETLYRYNVALAALDQARGLGPDLEPGEAEP